MALHKKWVIGIPLLAIIVLFVFFSMVSSDFKIESELDRKESLAPVIDFKLPDGTASSLEALRGTPLLINFWASWCSPCLEEMPSLRALEKHFPQKLKVLAINIQETPRSELEDKLQGVALPTHVLFNVKRSQIAQYKIESIPFSILINHEGRPIKTFEGPRDWDSASMIREIQELLK